MVAAQRITNHIGNATSPVSVPIPMHSMMPIILTDKNF